MKPEFWRSEDVASLDWDTRLLFIGLWSYVDDNSVGIDRLADIAADLFALDLERDPTGTFARVSRGLQTLAESGLIVRYRVAGRRVLAVTNFPRHQRIDKPNKPRYPGPDQAERETLARSSRDSRETPAPGTGEQGNRGTEEEEHMAPAPRPPMSNNTYSEEFEDFWQQYPRKTGKGEAAKAWEKARKRHGKCRITEGLARFLADPNLPTEQQFIPHAATWLNQSRYDDGPLPVRVDNRRPSRDETVMGWVDLANTYDDRKAIG